MATRSDGMTFQVFNPDEEVVAEFATYAEARDFADGEVGYLIRETFVGHWDNDKIEVEYVLDGVHEDRRIDTGFWEQGLFADSQSGATVEEAEAKMRAEYEDDLDGDDECK